jgi:signal transduction histidine kinase
LRHDHHRLYISVSDDGIGIPQDDLAMLFEPFHRAANTEALPGTGLGLTVVKQAVEMHGGSVEVNSRLGQGTTFHLTLPLG